MERCIHKRMYNYVISNDLITSYQSGFIKGDSTVYQLTFFYYEICQALDEGSVFDVPKAFDRIWHRGLIHKLSSLGIRGHLPNWFKSYLSDRKQRVVVSNSSSSWFETSAAVIHLHKIATWSKHQLQLYIFIK